MPLAAIGPVAPVLRGAPASAPRPGAASFGAVLEARAARTSPCASGCGPSPLPSALGRGLERIELARRRLDGLLDAARSGRTFTAQELIALQGDAYRYSQAVELSAKLVEQGAQAVKQALHAQV